MVKQTNEIAKFLLEAGTLKRVARSGWWLAGIKYPETVAEHSYRAALIAMVLAGLRKADVGKCMKMALLHDFPETRMNDLHKVAARYFEVGKAEKKIIGEQAKSIGKEFGKEYENLMNEFIEGKSEEAKIVKDADALECAIQAKEYVDSGHKAAKSWIKAIKKRLKTREAKEILKSVEGMKSAEWWKGLKKLND